MHDLKSASGATDRNVLPHAIIGGAIKGHKALGPGLLETAYEMCLVLELEANGLHVRRQVEVPITYRNRTIPCAYRIDLIVAREVIIEIKAVESILPIHESQIFTYMRLTGMVTGLLLNFNTAYLRNGIKRFVL